VAPGLSAVQQETAFHWIQASSRLKGCVSSPTPRLASPATATARSAPHAPALSGRQAVSANATLLDGAVSPPPWQQLHIIQQTLVIASAQGLGLASRGSWSCAYVIILIAMVLKSQKGSVGGYEQSVWAVIPAPISIRRIVLILGLKVFYRMRWSALS